MVSFRGGWAAGEASGMMALAGGAAGRREAGRARGTSLHLAARMPGADHDDVVLRVLVPHGRGRRGRVGHPGGGHAAVGASGCAGTPRCRSPARREPQRRSARGRPRAQGWPATTRGPQSLSWRSCRATGCSTGGRKTLLTWQRASQRRTLAPACPQPPQGRRAALVRRASLIILFSAARPGSSAVEGLLL